MEIIDAHVHCGREPQPKHGGQDIGDYMRSAAGTGISGALMFPPVIEVYERTNRDFKDTPQWMEKRKSANSYIIALSKSGPMPVIPSFFIWNDFAVEQLNPLHQGIKWHRHPDEPEYDYDNPRCGAAVEAIRRRNLPVCLEETFENTLRFIDEIAPGIRVVIPHCGRLNGGYETLREHGIWERKNIFTDTSGSTMPEMIQSYIDAYGCGRILFGSDFPFRQPAWSLENIMSLKISEENRQAILAGNLRALLAENRPD